MSSIKTSGTLFHKIEIITHTNVQVNAMVFTKVKMLAPWSVYIHFRGKLFFSLIQVYLNKGFLVNCISPFQEYYMKFCTTRVDHLTGFYLLLLEQYFSYINEDFTNSNVKRMKSIRIKIMQIYLLFFLFIV